MSMFSMFYCVSKNSSSIRLVYFEIGFVLFKSLYFNCISQQFEQLTFSSTDILIPTS